MSIMSPINRIVFIQLIAQLYKIVYHMYVNLTLSRRVAHYCVIEDFILPRTTLSY